MKCHFQECCTSRMESVHKVIEILALLLLLHCYSCCCCCWNAIKYYEDTWWYNGVCLNAGNVIGLPFVGIDREKSFHFCLLLKLFWNALSISTWMFSYTKRQWTVWKDIEAKQCFGWVEACFSFLVIHFMYPFIQVW